MGIIKILISFINILFAFKDHLCCHSVEGKPIDYSEKRGEVKLALLASLACVRICTLLDLWPQEFSFSLSYLRLLCTTCFACLW